MAKSSIYWSFVTGKRRFGCSTPGEVLAMMGASDGYIKCLHVIDASAVSYQKLTIDEFAWFELSIDLYSPEYQVIFYPHSLGRKILLTLFVRFSFCTGFDRGAPWSVVV